MLNWEEIVQNYIAKHTNQIRKVTQPLRDHFGIEYFTYHEINNSGKYTVLVDRPDWAEYYVSHEIFRNDPYLRHPRVYKSGITLMDNHGSEEYKEMVLQAGKTVLNADMGAILIQKTEDSAQFFGFCGNKKSSAIESLYLNHPQILRSFAMHFKKELGPILRSMQEEAGSLIDLKGEDFVITEPIHPVIVPATLIAYYKDLGMHSAVAQVEKLSAREKQCLHLLIADKSAKETAVALGLSRRTIEYYFENIKSKLFCWSKQELLQIAKILTETGLL